jgi:hypothetical protein
MNQLTEHYLEDFAVRQTHVVNLVVLRRQDIREE